MKLKRLMVHAAVAALMGGSALAQAADPAAPMADPMAPPQPAFTALDQMTVGDVVGLMAYDPAGNSIGEIDYVIIAPEGVEAIIGIGGFLGMGEYTVAMALDEFELREDGQSFELPTDKEALKALPEVDETSVEGLPGDTPLAGLVEPAEVPGAAVAPSAAEEVAPTECVAGSVDPNCPPAEGAVTGN